MITLQPENVCMSLIVGIIGSWRGTYNTLQNARMYSLEPFKIDLKGMKEDAASLRFSLDDAFFEAVEATEIRKGRVGVSVEIRRTADRYFELDFAVDGVAIVPCDRCLDDMEQPVSAEAHLVAKLGTEYSEDDDLITIDENEGVLDVAWFIYEFIALALPAKHVHAPGKCNRAMEELLEEHSAARSSQGQEEAIDPRWSGLEKLKSLNN